MTKDKKGRATKPIAILYSPTSEISTAMKEWQAHNKSRYTIKFVGESTYPQTFNQQLALLNQLEKIDYRVLVVDRLEHVCLGGMTQFLGVLHKLLIVDCCIVPLSEPPVRQVAHTLSFLSRVLEFDKNVILARREILKAKPDVDLGGRPRLEIDLEVVRQFETLQSAAEYYGCSPRTLSNRIDEIARERERAKGQTQGQERAKDAK